MFDPRDISSDPRTLTPQRPKRDYLKERQDRTRTGSRAEFDPRSGGEDFTSRTERAVAEIGMYRTVAYKDLSEAHFDGHPYATRRAVDRMIQQGDVQEQTAKGPQGGTYKVLTLTEKGVHRAEVAAQDQGLDSGQKARAAMLAEAKAQAKGQGEDSAEKKAQESRQWPGDTIAGRPRYLPPLYELIEGGKVLALNMPAGSNPALARAIGVMLKNAWLQALLMRPAQMKESPSTYFRPAVFICDEYQSFASVGEDDPTGDEKSFALTRQCRCIPIVATQSISSLRAVLGSSEAWRALLQTLRTRIFLSLSDDASAKIASELCGQVAKIKGSYTISETSKRAGVSPLSGRAGGSGGGSIGATKSFQERREAVFHPRDFALLGNCQAICLPYDGAQSLEPRRVYLKPHYLPLDHSYWRAKEAGQI